MNLGQICLFHKGFCMVSFSDNKQNAVTLPHSTQRKHAFLVETKEKSKSQKILKESFFGVIASVIRTQFHKVTTGWRY